MRRCTLALAVVFLAACSGKPAEKTDTTTPPAAVAAPAANTRADEDSIRVMMGRVGTAMSTADTAAITAVYADDGADFTPGMAPAEGRAALAKEYAGLFGSMKNAKMIVTPGSVIVAQSGDVAVSRASYELTATDAKGKPTTERGNVILGWKKVNGQWKVAMSMNAPTTPTPGM